MVIKLTKENSYLWNKDMRYNLILIKQTERYMNDMLQAKGFVTLCEVENSLGMTKKIIDFDNNDNVFKTDNVLYAWVLGKDDPIVLKCDPQENGDILIDVNCGEYPLVLNK